MKVQKLEKKPRRRIQRRLIPDESSKDTAEIPLSHQIQNSERRDGKENDEADHHPAKRSRVIFEEIYDLEQQNSIDVGCQTEQSTAASDYVAVRLQNKILENEIKLLKEKVEFLECANTSRDH
ncbi:uncharacterized protein [Argopecten irradians]|uniref:uncharacterized protein n=1 Tax=Argopecten irradians TaxID=31199 RepID=UPI00372493D5